MDRSREVGHLKRDNGLVFSLGVALALRLAAVIAVGHPELLDGSFEFKNDELSYHRPALSLATTGHYSAHVGGLPTANRPPGIILPIAALYWLISPLALLALAYIVVCSLAVVLVVRALARATTDDPYVVNVATLLAASLPTLLWTSSGIWSDAPALLFTLVTLWLLAERPASGRHWLLVGCAASLAYLNRPSALFVFPYLFLCSAWSGARGSRARNCAILLLAFALPISAWGLRNRLTLGEFFVGATVAGHTIWESNNPVTAGMALPAKHTQSGVDLAVEAESGRYLGSWVPSDYVEQSSTIDPQLSELEAHHAYIALTADFLRSQPSALARLLAYKVLRVFTAEPVASSISGDRGVSHALKRVTTLLERWFLLTFGALGMIWLYRTRSAARHHYAAFLAAGLVAVLVTYVNARFFLSVSGVLLVPAAIGVGRFWNNVGPRLFAVQKRTSRGP